LTFFQLLDETELITTKKKCQLRLQRGLKAAIASYQDQAFIQMVKEKTTQLKSFLYEELEKLDLFYIPSQANFILFRIDQDLSELTKKMEARKILVSPFEFHDKQWIRVNCGTKQELQTFIFSLAELA